MMRQSLLACLLLAPIASAATETEKPAPPACLTSLTVHPTIPASTQDKDRFAARLPFICRELKEAAVAAKDGDFSPLPQTPDPKTQLGPLARACDHLNKLDVSILETTFLSESDFASLRAAHDHLLATEALVAAVSGQVGKLQGPPVAALQSLGNIESNIMNGLATFVVARAKAESIQYLQEQLKTQVCGGAAHPYFVNSCTAIEGLSANVQLAAIGRYLQAAAARDLQVLPDTALDKAGCTHPSLVPSLAPPRVAYAFLLETQKGRPALEIGQSIHLMDALPCEKVADKNGCLETMKAIRVGSEVVDAIAQQEGINGLLDDRDEAKTFQYALSAFFRFQQIDSAGVKLTTSWKAANLQASWSYLHGAVARTATVAHRFKEMNGDHKKDFTDLDRLALVAESLRLGTSLASTAPSSLLTLSPEAKKSIAVADAVADLAVDLSDRNPAGVLVSAQELASRLSIEIPAPVAQWAPFVVEIATAKSSDEVAKAIETAAAPVNSYVAKYDRKGMINVNAFVGGAFGGEKVQGADRNFKSSVVGVFAPVGLHATKGTGKVHFGLMLSVINLGNLVSERLKEEKQTQSPTEAAGGTTSESVDKGPHTGLAQVFSPGLFFTLGIARSPLLIGAGIEVAPSARTLTVTLPDKTSTTKGAAAVRKQVFISIDVPLFPL